MAPWPDYAPPTGGPTAREILNRIIALAVSAPAPNGKRIADVVKLCLRDALHGRHLPTTPNDDLYESVTLALELATSGQWELCANEVDHPHSG